MPLSRLQRHEIELAKQKVERSFAAETSKALNKYIKQTITNIELGEQRPSFRSDQYLAASLKNIIEAQSKKEIELITKLTLSNFSNIKTASYIKKYLDPLEVFNEIEQHWFSTQAFRNVSAIVSNTREIALRAIFAEPTEMTQRLVAKRLRELLPVNRHRAITIARTETQAAAQYASRGTAEKIEQDAGVELYKFWEPTLDGRTRDSHGAMVSSKGIRLPERFSVGGVLMDRPGDPAGGAANVVNCRCDLSYNDTPERD